MIQPTTLNTTAQSPLLTALWTLLLAHRSAFRQDRPFRRLVLLVFGSLFTFSRHTFTQILIALGLVHEDWSACYRLWSTPRFDYSVLLRCFLRQTLAHVPPTQPYVVAVDGVQILRHSRTMPGTAWLRHPQTPAFKPGPCRAQRFVHLAWLPQPSPEGYSRAISLQWQPAFPSKAVPAADHPPRKEWEAGLDALRWLRRELDAAGSPAQRVLAVADGSYSIKDVWAALPPGVTLLARTAKNRALWTLPGPARGRGRPRRYGERAPTPGAWLAERAGWRQTTVAVRGRVFPLTFRTEGPYLVRGAPAQPLYLLVVRGSHQGKRQRKPAFWLVSAVEVDGRWELPWPPEMLLAWAWQRWEIEVAHREMKAGLGVGEAQCWNPRSAVLAVQGQAWRYGVLVLAGYRAWGLGRGPVRPPGRWWGGSGRWSLGSLWQGYRHALWGQADFQRVFTTTTGDWLDKADTLAALSNAAFGSRRA